MERYSLLQIPNSLSGEDHISSINSLLQSSLKLSQSFVFINPMSQLVALLYHNGRKFEGGEGGMVFEGEARAIQLKRGMSMDSLKQRIRSKLKLGRNQVISGVTYRFFMSENPNKFTGLELFDDEDVDCMIHAFKEQKTMMIMELYVDIDQAGSSSIPAPTCSMSAQQALTEECDRRIEETDTEVEHGNVDATVNLVVDTDDRNDYNVDADAVLSEDGDESAEGQLLDEDSSDTEVEEDANFERTMTPVLPASPIPSPLPLNVYSESQDVSTIPFWNSVPHYSYINWEYPDQEDDFHGLDVPDSWHIGEELYVGLRFDSKHAVQLALKHYAMKIHQSYHVVESKPTLLSVRCPNSTDDCVCPLRMRAMLSKKSNKWVITKWGGQHTCADQMFSMDHNKCDSEFICSCILGMVRDEPYIPISFIQERIREMFGYTVSYNKAWKAKQKAIAKVFGDWDESYNELPRWLNHMLFSPGSFYTVVIEDYKSNMIVDHRFRTFRRVFWTFKQCCDAFNYCKPIIQMDGTFLYGKYRGTLLIATTQDGNSHALPIAFAIVEGETLSAWSWFLRLIRLHVTRKQGICLITNKNIKSAVADAFLGWQPPNAYHVYCIRHIASSFNHIFKNAELKQELIMLGYEPCAYQFERRLVKFREFSPAIQQWVDNIRKDSWSLAYDEGGRRFGHMTTNLSEVVNKVLKGVRNLPITALVKCTYGRLATYFVNRSGQARAELTEGKKYCQKIMEALQKNQVDASSQKVTKLNLRKSRFEVEEPLNPVTQRGGMKWKVHLSRGYCECGRFQAYKYPCSHVIAACAHVDADFYQYVDPAYTIHNVAQAYQAEWMPIGNDLNIPPSSGPRVVPDPSTVRGKGRPKSTRIRNEMDLRESQPTSRCRYCNQQGHNRVSCPRLAARVNALFEDENEYDS